MKKNQSLTEQAISVQNLVFEYPGLRALNEVGFEIVRGSITALVGPNGAGKTTLMRCIAGLDTPLSGEILVDGMDVLQHPRESHRRMGFLADNFGLYANLSIQQSLAHTAATQGMLKADIEQAVLSTAEKLGLADRLQQQAGTLSRGLRQRLAIGQAIIHQPSVLLLDEPASGLDPEARYHLSTLFCQLRDEGMTLLVSSHILAELEEYSSHMLVLKAGKVLEQRVINATIMAPQAKIFTLRLAATWSGLADFLNTQAGVSDVVIDGQHAQFELVSDALVQSSLLRELVVQGAPVIHFAEQVVDMQSAYLASVQLASPTQAKSTS